MIKLFRKIRQQLLTENKFNKYLLYAIGEIILVVIGILIALQINTWNEDDKKRSLKESYLKALIVDLSKDTIEINNVLSYQIKDSLKIATHQLALTKEDASLEDLLNIKVYDWNPKITNLQRFNTNTAEALVSTGNINLIDSGILNYMTNLRGLQEAHISSIIPFTEFYRNIGDPAVHTPTSSTVINKGPIFNKMLKSMDKMAIAYKFNGRLSIKRQAYRNSTRNLNKILLETKALIKLIEGKIKP